MGRIVKLKESDLVNIINKIMNEQKVTSQIIKPRYGVDPSTAPSDYLGKGRQFEKESKFKKLTDFSNYENMVSKIPNMECLPNNQMRYFVLFVTAKKKDLMKDLGVDEKTLSYLTKIAIAIMGWQSDFGKTDKLYDIKPIAKYINPWDVYNTVDGILKNIVGSGTAAKGTEWLAKKFGVDEPSFGPAEFMPSTFAKTGVEKKYGKGMETVIGSGLAVIYNMLSKYRQAEKNGLSSQPSVNQIAKTKGIDGWVGNIGTGNHLWDVAIASHTYPDEKILVKYCATNRPDFMAPCSNSTYEPFSSDSAWQSFRKHKWNQIYYGKNKNLDVFPGKLTVNRGQQIPNYLPYLTGTHGTISGQEEGIMDNLRLISRTNDRINEFKCVDDAIRTNVSYPKFS